MKVRPRRVPAALSQIGLGWCLHADTSRQGADVTSNTRVPRAEITGPCGAVLRKISRKMFGAVPEPLEVLWHHRPVLRFSLGLGRKATKWNECDEDLKSYAHMAVASLIGCTFCLDLGYFQAHNEGLDEARGHDRRSVRRSPQPVSGSPNRC
jgi:hypothetical protein